MLTMAIVIAIGVKNTGEREVLGFDLGTSENSAFWLAFLRSLVARGLHGVKLAISDAHEGLRAAIETVWVGSACEGSTNLLLDPHRLRHASTSRNHFCKTTVPINKAPHAGA